ncbi:MAG: nucleoside triphosphate pyrophosphohydrolase [Candidatus Aminicenantes bacterium]|nr:nucleoside triphosphate pyrophosphohydrolase [Candidatus Aminicenantes bacterium]
MSDAKSAGEEFARLGEILAVLRGDNGCPWDREQDEKSLLSFLLEEAYEAVEAVQSGRAASVREELGDLLLEIVFLARVYEEKGAFRLSEVVKGINDKMIARHPHVFGSERRESSREVLGVWNRRKQEEKKHASLLDGVSKSQPALAAAFQAGQRASAAGFDWPTTQGALEKLREETGELDRALESGSREAVVHEIGDLLLAAANVSRKAGVNPELALLQANGRFRDRFAHLERRLKDEGREFASATPGELDALWEEAKSRKPGR